MRLEIEPEAPRTLAQLHAEHKARQARLRAAEALMRVKPSATTTLLRREEWTVGAQSIFALALIRWWAWECRVRAIAAAARAKKLRVRSREHATRGERIRKMFADVAAAHGVRIHEITGPMRASRICRPRFEAAYRLSLMNLSLPQIGRWLGGRDHTTVLNSIRQHCKRTGAQLPPRMRA